MPMAMCDMANLLMIVCTRVDERNKCEHPNFGNSVMMLFLLVLVGCTEVSSGSGVQWVIYFVPDQEM